MLALFHAQSSLTPRSTTCRSAKVRWSLRPRPQCFDISLWQLVFRASGRRSYLADLTGGDPIRRAFRLHYLRRSGRRATVRAVLSLSLLCPTYSSILFSCLTCISFLSPAISLKKELLQLWFSSQPYIKLVNSYYLTETSDYTFHEIMYRVPERERFPLGLPIYNVVRYVVYEHLSPVPLCAPCFIVFSFICVCRFYFNYPERTLSFFHFLSSSFWSAALPDRRLRPLSARMAN